MSDQKDSLQTDSATGGQFAPVGLHTPTALNAAPTMPIPTDGPKRSWDAITWSTVVNSACTFVALVVALFLGLRSLRLSEESLRATNESLRLSNLATIYTLGHELTKFDLENPNLSKFFDKEVRKPWVTEKELWEEFTKLPRVQQTKELREEYSRLWEEYQALDNNEKVKIYMACEGIASFSQIVFMQRDALPADDWDTWWSYITDTYDESPHYRMLLSKRAGWYAFTTAVTPENRAKYFRSKQKM